MRRRGEGGGSLHANPDMYRSLHPWMMEMSTDAGGGVVVLLSSQVIPPLPRLIRAKQLLLLPTTTWYQTVPSCHGIGGTHVIMVFWMRQEVGTDSEVDDLSLDVGHVLQSGLAQTLAPTSLHELALGHVGS